MMNAETPQPPRRERHLFRWFLLSLLVLLFASTAALFQWGDMESMPGFVKIWKLRGEVLVCQIRYGRDNQGTQDARLIVAKGLVAQGSYKSAENQYRAMLA